MSEFSARTDPLAAFRGWFAQAVEQNIDNFDVAAVATADVAAAPSVRFVNYRGMHDGGLLFYTNYTSRKATQLASNPVAAMVFHWAALRRQVTVEGRCVPAPAEVSDAYFATRDRESQLTTLASRQSAELDCLAAFEAKIEALRETYANRDIPRPAHWGAMLLTPSRIEFRTSGKHRRHRRWLFERGAEEWTLRLLYP